MMLHNKYQSSRPYGFRQEYFSFFSLYKPIKNVTQDGAHFWPQGHNLNKIGRGLLVDATCQISRQRPGGLKQEGFSVCDLDMQQTKKI